MTIDEIHEHLRKSKIDAGSIEKSIEVQKKLKSLGYISQCLWPMNEEGYILLPYIFIAANLIDFTGDKKIFDGAKLKKVEVEDFFNL